MALLEVKDLEKSFIAGDKPIAALDKLTLAIEEHEFVSIVGPSGCGKSTFLHIVGGFEPASAGAVTLNGGMVTKPNQAVRVGDFVVVPRGGVEHTVQVLALGTRRGPAVEARALYRQTATVRLRDAPSDWVPLLGEDDAADRLSPPRVAPFTP